MEHFINGYIAFWHLFNVPWSKVLEKVGWLGGLGSLVVVLTITAISLSATFRCMKRRKKPNIEKS